MLAACESKPGNFSQFPGFDAWFSANPPSNQPAGAEQIALLKRYKPRLFIGSGSGRPIRFYEDYIANGTLTARNGEVVVSRVDQSILNRYREDPGAVFSHQPSDAATAAQAIVRVDSDVLPGANGKPDRELLFLTYHYVFAHSGIAAGIRSWQYWLLGWFADLTDWHQLDHYTAVSVVLDKGSLRPIALMLQQHNYLRTWLVAQEEGPGTMSWPQDDRVKIVAAVDSNELYRWRAGRQLRRALPGMSPDNVHWLVNGEDRPLMTADDITDPSEEVNYTLHALAPSDAFFVFKGWLGERRRTPGRDGPPGADYNTIPALKSRAVQLATFYWYEGDDEYTNALQAWPSDRWPTRADVAPLIARFAKLLDAHQPMLKISTK